MIPTSLNGAAFPERRSKDMLEELALASVACPSGCALYVDREAVSVRPVKGSISFRGRSWT